MKPTVMIADGNGLPREMIRRVIELTLVGYWRSDLQPHLPDPRALVDPEWDSRERDLVIEYLKGGLPILHMMGYSPCRMCDLDANGASEFADGTYLWPEGLVHYLEEHSLRLPQKFVQHVVTRFYELDAAAVRAHHRPMDEWLQMSNGGVV